MHTEPINESNAGSLFPVNSLALGSPEPTRYIRSTWMIYAENSLKIKGLGEIRLMSSAESEKLSELITKRNVFARHSRENSFYAERAKELGGKTVIEIFDPGLPDDIAERAEQAAYMIERLVILSMVLSLKRADLLRALAISTKPRTEINLSISPGFRYLRSRNKREPAVRGAKLDVKAANRFLRCGFNELADWLNGNSWLVDRTWTCLQWLYESRTEARQTAALVKTAIALESLLVFSESEAIAKSLSERTAFLISNAPSDRKIISKFVKRFYDARSGVVHGSRKKTNKITPQMLEIADRLLILIALSISANSSIWPNQQALQNWFEDQRWGEPDKGYKHPFPKAYLNSLIEMASQELSSDTEN